MEYKAGDIVEIVSDEHRLFDVTIGRYYEMAYFDRELYAIVNDRGCKQYFDERDKGVRLVKEFTKKDLKVGYLLEFESGDIEILVPIIYCDVETLAYTTSFEDGNCQQIYDYDEKIENWKRFRHFADEYGDKLVRVYGLPKTTTFRAWNSKQTIDRDVLWEREEEIKEVTMQELENHYGCKVKVVK